MSGFVQDLRYIIRVLRGAPAFTAVAVLSLAIGIGANTVMFSVARFTLLDPMPVDRPDQLRVVQWASPGALRVSQYNSGGSTDPSTGRSTRTNYNYATARALEQAVTSASMFAFNFISQLTVGIEGQSAVAAGGLMASGRYFAVLRPPLMMGRGLTDADDTASAPNAAVISHAFWRRAFASDPNVLGKPVTLNGTPFVVVGVTGPSFRGLSTGTRFAPVTDVTVPIAKQPLVFAPEPGLMAADNRLWLRVIARVPDGVDEGRVSRELTSALRGALASAPFVPAEALRDIDVVLFPGARGIDSIARNAERPVTILTAVVGVVLLIACVNLASLSLARGMSRQRELSVRRALGASRGRLIRQLLLESVVIAVGGGLVGGVIALWAFPLVSTMVTSGFGAGAVELPRDWRTFGVTMLVSGIAGLLFGILPALGLTRPDRTTHLRHQTTGASAPKLTIGRLLLALQIAISIPLVVTTGLLLATVNNLSSIDVGFNPAGLVMFRLDPNQALGATAAAPASSRTDIDRFVRDLIARLETVPGVRSATLVENALLSGWVSNNFIVVDGEQKSIHMNGVGPRYFETMEIPVLAGRVPTLEDTRASPRVAVVNETAARQLFGNPAPIGRRFTMGKNDIEIVGVVADSKYSGLRTDVVPTMFDPFLQRASAGAMFVIVRAAGPIAGIEGQLRAAVAGVNANVPITEMRTQVDQLHASMGRERLVSRLMLMFGSFALVLACIGLYGATSYAVARRTNEIGLRVALGARRVQVLWLILRQVLVLVGVGLAVGVPAAVAATPLVGSLLYGLGPRDPTTIVGAALVMVIVAVIAGLIPARRAARMEVLRALRQE